MSFITFQATDWDTINETTHPGESGTAHWRTLRYGDLRIRKVRYSENYKANHWCKLGHIVYCIKGEFISEQADGSVYKLTEGMSYQVSDDASAHRTLSKTGATLLIIDGKFLSKKESLFNPWRM